MERWERREKRERKRQQRMPADNRASVRLIQEILIKKGKREDRKSS